MRINTFRVGCKAILLVHGKNGQRVKTAEECAELTQAVLKDCPAHIAEEIADVEIMCEQMKQAYDIASLVDSYKKQKIAREIGRIKTFYATRGIDIPDNAKKAFKVAEDALSEEIEDPTRWAD